MMRGNAGNSKFTEDGVSIFLNYHPVKMEGASDPWYVLSIREERVAMQTRDRVIMVILLSSAIIVVLALALVFLVARSITAPLKSMSEVFEFIGEGDFTRSVEAKTNDEIGNISALLTLPLRKSNSS